MATRKRGYVALFDVLGFSDRVSRDALHGLDAYVDTVVNLASPDTHLGTILFSDTVVLYSFDDNDRMFYEIICVSSGLLHNLIAVNVPVRGAIAHGDFVRSEHERHHGTVIAGRPIIDAYHYESRLQWIGVMLTPSLLERRPDVSVDECSFEKGVGPLDDGARFKVVRDTLMIQPCSIPLEDETGSLTSFDGFAVVPVNPVLET